MIRTPPPPLELIPLLAALGLAPSDIQRVLGVSEQTIRTWVSRVPLAAFNGGLGHQVPSDRLIQASESEPSQPTYRDLRRLAAELEVMVRYLPDEGVVGLRAGWLRQRLSADDSP